MSWPVLPLGPSLLAMILLITLSAPFTVVFVRGLELGRRARLALALATLGGGVVIACAFLAWKSGVFPGAAWGVTIVWLAFPILGAMALSLPVALLVQRVPGWFTARRSGAKPRATSDSPKLSRRAALGVPLLAGGVAGYGFTGGVQPAILRTFRVPAASLHPDLDGLRVLQLSDLHLGVGLDSRDLRALLPRLAAACPDLVLLTGDIADTPEALEDGLAILERLKPRYGHVAVLGNHEYLSQRIDRMLEIYRSSRVRLLVNEALDVSIGRATLALIGSDDPLGTPEPELARSIEELGAAARQRGVDYSLLLSHRPSGFEPAARAGVDLTLAGHTHGGQVGWLGRLAELTGAARFVWGFYRSRKSALYTTSGAGDWFPFRVDCPREAPLFVLTRA